MKNGGLIDRKWSFVHLLVFVFVHVCFANTIQMCHMRTFTMGNGKALLAGHLYQAKDRLCFPNRVEFFKVI